MQPSRNPPEKSPIWNHPDLPDGLQKGWIDGILKS